MSRKTSIGGSSNYKIAPKGTHVGRCFALAYIGTQEVEFQGHKDYKEQVMFGFEYSYEKAVFNESKGEEPFGLWTYPFTHSLADRANLTRFILSWRNRDKFTEEEIKEGFDLSVVVGKACQMNVVHKEWKSDSSKISARIDSVIGLAKGMEMPPKCSNEPYLFDIAEAVNDKNNVNKEVEEAFYKLPKFIREMIRNSKEYIEMKLNWPEEGDDAGYDNAEDDAFGSSEDPENETF